MFEFPLCRSCPENTIGLLLSFEVCFARGQGRNESNHGSVLLLEFFSSTGDSSCFRFSVDAARGRGTSAHARARRPGRTPSERAGGLASRARGDAAVAFIQWAAAASTTPPAVDRAARYPSTGSDGRFRLARRGTGRDGPRRGFVSGTKPRRRHRAHARTRGRISRRNEPPPLYIPPHRTARVEDSSEQFRPTQAKREAPAAPARVAACRLPLLCPISLALAPLLLSRELARLLSLLLWLSAAIARSRPQESRCSCLLFYLVLNMSTSVVQIYFWCILLFANAGISAYLPLERDALLDVKSHLEDPQNYLSNWDESHSPCEFYGVTCDKISGEVTGVSLSNVSLSGTISPSFSVLRQLHTLDLSANSISAIIPAALTSCTNLQVLNLSMNSMEGQLPDLSSLLKLQVLDLSTNSFSGAFPVWISKLSGLTELGLGENNFDESDVPENIGLLKNLTWLFLGQCNLRGEIPASVFDLESLGTLDFSRNQMTGVFPKAISKLHNLWKIELYQNNLTGEIPPELAHLTLLSEFDVSQNQLTGVLPKEIVRLKKLKVFHIYRNNFYGELPEGLGDLQFLESFSTYENQFSGKFPANLGRFSPLNAIDISENFFSGEFPKFLCQNNKLQFLLALSNNFSGEFPSSYTYCKTLERFRVSQNQFTGSIPYGMWGLPNAVIIDVADNGFIGGISSDIGISSTLNQLLVQNNSFSGELPKELGNLSQLQKLDASNNRFSGQIPTQIGNLKQLSYLHLQHNAVEGSIHPEIGLCTSLVDLNLAENSLSGEIPDTLGSLLMLNSLNLSHNMISGEIPEGLQSLKLSYVDFSHNNLSGPVPLQLLMIAGDDAFSENSDLCVSDTSEGWTQSSTSLPPCQWTDNHHNFSRRRLFSVLIIVSSLVVLLSSLACLRYENNRLEVFNRKLDTESGDDSDPKWIIESFCPPEVNQSASLPLPRVT